MKQEGRDQIGAGPDFSRRSRRIEQGIRRDSPVYNLERMETKNYRGYQKKFQRTGRYSGGVPGFD